ncbi:DNA-binding protein [Pseudoxanthomonas jiangsuensis]|uniref:DNA-binding protein n=1 Tax=Pseudoxanthomonas jiangsuensis TaxID=619688 RepID=UPI0013909984|nr:DNA-binding protein [Pseudoxanthomonas jiangsuensis]KAF1692726.1 DNA-binding protein [Pseudoxanthomonas jiangsuensis]
MSRTAKVLTPEQVKERLRLQGKTTTQWAAEHGFTRNEVYRVLNGQAKAHYGKAHEIAVLLGLKPGSEEELASRPSGKATTGAATRNLQARAAA